MWRFDKRWILAGALLALIPATSALAERLSPPSDLVLGATDRAFRQGDQGERVVTLQTLLKQAGSDPGKIDGIYGPITEGAVRRAQAASGLPVDGFAGMKTVAALEQKVASHWRESVSAAVTAATEPAATEPIPFALTFNGALDPNLVPQVLGILDKHGMKATFFVSGETAVDRPELLASIANRGHEIGNNGYGLDEMTVMTEPTMRAQVERTQDAILLAIGKRPAFFRPPLGKSNDSLATAVAGARLSMALWSNVQIRDLPSVEPAVLASRWKDAVYPNAVLMLYQDRPNSVQALDLFLTQVGAKGYRSVTLSALPGR